MTSLLEDGALDGSGRFWYDRARRFYDAWDGDPTQYTDQAKIWLDDYDYGMAMIAWNLVEMEEDESFCQ